MQPRPDGSEESHHLLATGLGQSLRHAGSWSYLHQPLAMLPYMTERFPVIRFNQFGSGTSEDELVLFAAPALMIAAWAGIPRKGWRVRMLYQRWITPGREKEVKAFWDDAGQRDSGKDRYLLGPTALTLAATYAADINADGIALEYSPPFLPEEDEFTQLSLAASAALQTITPRLDSDELAQLDQFGNNLGYVSTDYEPNHVLQSAIQIAQLAYDPEDFCARNDITAEERAELLEALEALCRPALVVDGQHRLMGAALSVHRVNLPVVLIQNANWLDQIYQFIVVNETAKRVPTDLLTDIFGNSLTPREQGEVRGWLAKSHVEVEPRIAAVVAGSHPDSPFRGIIRLQLGGGRPQGYVTEITVRQLIEGGRGGTPGWRKDPDFIHYYVRPTFEDTEEWESWTNGHWRPYWFAFWDEVAKFYNAEVAPSYLWGPEQTNLTKAVTLRLLQELFMTVVVEEAKAAEKAAESLRSVLESRVPAEELEQLIAEESRKAAVPQDIDEFRQRVREGFLADGVPVRVFTRPWVTSLDDEAGITNLRLELRKAFDLTKRHERYRAQNKDVFAVEDRD